MQQNCLERDRREQNQALNFAEEEKDFVWVQDECSPQEEEDRIHVCK